MKKLKKTTDDIQTCPYWGWAMSYIKMGAMGWVKWFDLLKGHSLM